MSTDTYRLRRRLALTAIAELRHVHDCDERRWLQSPQQRSLAGIRAAHLGLAG